MPILLTDTSFGAGPFGAGPFGGSIYPSITTEIAFTTEPDAAVPAWQDVSSYTMGISTRRGRQYELDQIQAGTLSVRLNNGDRRFDPSYTKSPYYPYVLPMRKIRISATWNGVTYYLFTGYIERWPIVWEAPKWGSVTITAVDAFAALSQATISGTFAQDYTGNRIQTVLSAASWPASSPAAGYWTLDTSALDSTTVLSYGVPTTLIATGRTQAQAVTIADTDEVSALTHIEEMASTERGVFFADGQGRLVFNDRWSRYNATSLVTFTDGASSAGRLPYDLATQPDFDVARVVNEAKVTATGGVTQTASDGASRSRYFRRNLTLPLPLTTDDEASQRAWFEVTAGKEPKLRFDRLPVKPVVDPSHTWQYALGLELGDKVTVERTPGSDAGIVSETIIRSCFVEAVEHSIAPDGWQTTFELSPSQVWDQFFVLDTAVLDSASSAVLAY